MKRRILKWGLGILVGICVLCGVAYEGYYFMAVRPTEELNALSVSRKPMDPGDVRQLCHRVISTPWGNAHDAFLGLVACGDASSVPYLINALRWQDSPYEGGNMVCTTAHCLQALYVITGQDFGYDPDKWEVWWDKNKGTFRASEGEMAARRAPKSGQRTNGK